MNAPILLHGGQCKPVVSMSMKRGECPTCRYQAFGLTAEAVFLAMADHWKYETHLQTVGAAGDTQGDA